MRTLILGLMLTCCLVLTAGTAFAQSQMSPLPSDDTGVSPNQITQGPCLGPDGSVQTPTTDVNGDGRIDFFDCNELPAPPPEPRPEPPDTSRGSDRQPVAATTTTNPTALAATGLNLTVGSVLVALLLVTGGFMLVAARRRSAGAAE